MTRHWKNLALLLVYALAAIAILWPGVSAPNSAVPGGSNTDLWNGLWSLDYARDALLSARAPWNVDCLAFQGPLGPDGGSLAPIDPLAVLWFIPLGAFGIPFAYNVLIVLRLALAGVLAHRFAEEFSRAHGLAERPSFWGASIAGLTMAMAPVLIAGVHNGTTEAANATGLIFAVWMGWRFAREPSTKNACWAAIGLFWASLTSWYVAVLVFCFAGFVALFQARDVPVMKRWRPVVWGLLAIAPWLILVLSTLSSGDANLSSHSFDLALETPAHTDNFAASGWSGWFSTEGSRAVATTVNMPGEGFFHNSHVPWVLWIAAFLAGRSLWRKEKALVALLGCSFVLSLGASSVIGPLRVPMPYGALKALPGFSQLGLPFRFSIAGVLVIALLASHFTAKKGLKWGVPIGVLTLLQLFFLSPIDSGVPAQGLARPASVIALERQPAGAAVHVPATAYQRLYFQRLHKKKLTASLNQPSSPLDEVFWDAVRVFRQKTVGRQKQSPEVMTLREELVKEFERIGIRYLLVESGITKSRRDLVRQTIDAHFDTLSVSDRDPVKVYVLW